MSLTTFKNRKWKRQRNDNDAYLEDLNQIVDQVNALPGTSTVLGYFATLAALTAAHPAGANGQFAVVGNTIYIWDPITSAWVTIGDTLYKGVLDASAGIPYPAAQVGEFWRISVAGTIGTAFVEEGDQVICTTAYAGGMDDSNFMIIQTSTQVTQVTHAQLLDHITNGTLETGRLYQIWDFVQAYNIFDGGTNAVIETQAGIGEALIVKATSQTTLAREAYSPTYPQDIIYYNPTGAGLTTDVGYSDGAGNLIPILKGVIEFRHDTKQNVSTWYDFRNIKFRRWAVDAVAYNGATAYVANDVCKSGVDGKIYKCLTATTGEGDPTVNTADWILWWDITADAYISWTTDNTKFNIGDITTDNLIFVPATYQDVYTFGSWYNHVNNVTIGNNNLTVLIAYGYNTTLNNIVFKTTDAPYTCYSNEIGEVSYNNTIGNAFNSNTIGYGFSYNIIKNNFSNNTIGNTFYSNTIGTNFKTNTIGNGFVINTIGIGFVINTIGNDFSGNTIGNGFNSNTIGNYFSRNTIGNAFHSNTIGNGFETNTIGNGFETNTIGNNSKVSAGINCQGNSIGDYNTQVTLGDNCTGISIGEKNDTITLGSTNTDISIGNGNIAVTIGDDCTGCTIGNGNEPIVFGASNSNIFVGDGNAITTGASCLSIDIGESNTITLGTGCVNLTFLNGCVFNTNTAPDGLQNNIFESGTNITATDFTSATFIKAAYNTTVFENSASVVMLRYFDALNALTVANVNA